MDSLDQWLRRIPKDVRIDDPHHFIDSFGSSTCNFHLPPKAPKFEPCPIYRHMHLMFMVRIYYQLAEIQGNSCVLVFTL
jgi:hypothetical protein